MSDKEKEWKEAFDLLDADGSGKIERKEVENLLEKLELTKEDAKIIADEVMEADTSGDGKISWEEFKAAMKKQTS